MLKQDSSRCASVGGLSRNPDQRSPTVTPVLLLRCCVLIFRNPENSTHRTCKFAFSPWSKYLTRLWSQRPISREGAHPFNWGRTLLVQLGGVFFDKTLAEGPSAAPVRFCLWHTVRIDSSCAQCKYLSVVPTVNSVPPAVVPPASRVPPSRHCTFQFVCFVVLPKFTYASNTPSSFV